MNHKPCKTLEKPLFEEDWHKFTWHVDEWRQSSSFYFGAKCTTINTKLVSNIYISLAFEDYSTFSSILPN